MGSYHSSANLIQHLLSVGSDQLDPLICAQQHPARGLSQCWVKAEAGGLG